jgi:uncharacterized protein
VKLNVKRIPVDGEDFAGSEPPSILEVESDADMAFERPVEYTLHAQLQGRSVLVTGRLATEAMLRCGRCLKPFRRRLTAKEFVFLQELSGEDFVDLTPQMREDILLELPQRAICQPDCKGLCPVCGKNLNEGACGCKVSREDLRWQALNKLKLT